MIRWFLAALLALGLGAGLALMLAGDPGYVLVAFRGYTLELTLATLMLSALLVLVGLVALSWLLRLANPLRWFRGGRLRGWFSRSSAAEASANGLQQLLLGNWHEAYRILVAQAPRVDNPAFNYLAAAFAAFRRDDRIGWTWCLDQAEKLSRRNNYGLISVRAWLETQAGKPDQALPLLLALQRIAPGSPFVLQQLADNYDRLGDWERLVDLWPELVKHKVLPEPALHKLGEQVWQRRLQQAATEGLQPLRLAWQSLPKALHNNEALVGLLLQQLLKAGQETEAGVLLNRQLKQGWSDSLIGMLGHVDTRNPQQLLLQLENRLKERPHNAVLLLTLGRISLRNQLWGKAREFFEQALRASKETALSAEINAELGRLYENLGEAAQGALGYFLAFAKGGAIGRFPQPQGQRDIEQGIEQNAPDRSKQQQQPAADRRSEQQAHLARGRDQADRALQLGLADDVVNQQLRRRVPQHAGQAMNHEQCRRMPHLEGIGEKQQAPSERN